MPGEISDGIFDGFSEKSMGEFPEDFLENFLKKFFKGYLADSLKFLKETLEEFR